MWKNSLIISFSLGLVHTDDRLALLEIVKQLDVKEDFGDKITVSYHLSDDNIPLPVLVQRTSLQLLNAWARIN